MSDHTIRVCMGSSCFARGNIKNLDLIEHFIKEHNLEAKIELTGALCQEKCETGPNIYIDGILYNDVNEDKLNEILNGLLVK